MCEQPGLGLWCQQSFWLEAAARAPVSCVWTSYALGESSSVMLYSCKNVFDLQQQNFKQKVVALLKRFKVSDEVSNVLYLTVCVQILRPVGKSNSLCFLMLPNRPVSIAILPKLAQQHQHPYLRSQPAKLLFFWSSYWKANSELCAPVCLRCTCRET